MDRNAAGIGYDTMNMLTITGLGTLPTSSFEWSVALKPSTTREKRSTPLCTTWAAPKVGRCTTNSRPWVPQVEWNTSRVAPQWCVPTRLLWWCTSPPSRAVPHRDSLLDSAGSTRRVHAVLGRSTCHTAVLLVASVEHHVRRVGEIVHLRRDAWGDSVGERPILSVRIRSEPTLSHDSLREQLDGSMSACGAGPVRGWCRSMGSAFLSRAPLPSLAN